MMLNSKILLIFSSTVKCMWSKMRDFRFNIVLDFQRNQIKNVLITNRQLKKDKNTKQEKGDGLYASNL